MGAEVDEQILTDEDRRIISTAKPDSIPIKYLANEKFAAVQCPADFGKNFYKERCVGKQFLTEVSLDLGIYSGQLANSPRKMVIDNIHLYDYQGDKGGDLESPGIPAFELIISQGHIDNKGGKPIDKEIEFAFAQLLPNGERNGRAENPLEVLERIQAEGCHIPSTIEKGIRLLPEMFRSFTKIHRNDKPDANNAIGSIQRLGPAVWELVDAFNNTDTGKANPIEITADIVDLIGDNPAGEAVVAKLTGDRPEDDLKTLAGEG